MKVTEVAANVHLATGTNVNWGLVTDGTSVTLVDAGYPNDTRALLASLAAIGRRPEDVVAIVLTHAHLDHMGGIPMMTSRYGTPVVTGEEEVRHARRDYLQQMTPAEMLGQCRHLRGVTWVGQTLKAVLPHLKMALTDVRAVPFDVALDVPGGLVPVSTPGHTNGHTAYLLPSAGVLFSGDALVTGHPLSTLPPGPQLLPSVFNHDEPRMITGLRELGALPADILVPGHGDVARGALSDLVARVRTLA
ncbi:MBL fold metallo-hydrolase [Pseudonocardia spinosispora]|uniref:MBL fold metallo-hydrolase n=1 Tax=Pseudonocardia spinosispora TaxID=103441 RepID=UPI0003F97163|nr:MBL fold metallo-hydrolase [Pseudonocardia spinosispora]